MDDFSQATLAQLVTLARQRFGAAAASLKTRAELIAALRGEPLDVPRTLAAPSPVEVVVTDFFVARK